jgi:hypothetical protein
VNDLSALRGMPLSSLNMNYCNNLTDLSPLADVKTLKYVTLPYAARQFDFLRNLPKLERLSYSEDPDNYHLPDKTAAEFWKEFDANHK